MQPKKIKSKNNGCGTAPVNLVLYFYGPFCLEISLTEYKVQSNIQKNYLSIIKYDDIQMDIIINILCLKH